MGYRVLSRFQLLFFLVISTILLLIQTQKCIERYFRYETGVSVEYQSSKRTTFPEFTVCPNFRDCFREDFLLQYGSSTVDYRNGRLPRVIGGNLDIKDFHRQASLNLSEVVIGIDFETSSLNTSEIHNYVRRISSDTVGVWREHPNMVLGRCYSLTVPKDLVQRGIQNAKLEFYGSPYIFIHHPGQFMDPDTKAKIITTVGKQLFSDILYELTYLIDQKELEKEEEGEEEASASKERSFTCDPRMNFMFDQCLYENAAKAQFAKYGCTGPAVPEFNYPSCNVSAFNQSFQDEFYKFSWNLRYLPMKSDCLPPCAGLTYIQSYPDSGDHVSNRSMVKLYFKRNVKVTTHIYTYDMVSLLAEIGGYTGLLLGFSVFQISTVVDIILRRLDQKMTKTTKFRRGSSKAKKRREAAKTK